MTIVIFLCFVLMIVYGRQIDAYRRAWNSIPVLEFPAIPGSIPLVRVSVLVAVRNEEETLPVLFTALAAQDYPKTLLQLIFIDDHSTDRSGDLLEGFSQQRENLLVLRLPEGLESKKKAIEAGIEAASGELIITTDADSVQPQTWISTIVACYSSTEGKFIAAPVKMKARWSLLGIFQTLDFITLQGITGAAVSKGMHALCNGANLAYTREAFLEVGGFEGVDQLPSGDDVFLMQKVFRVYPTGVRYLKSPLATVETPTEKTWGNFFNQRIRWASKAVHYKDNKLFFILLVTYLANLGFLVLAVASIIDRQWLPFLLLLLAGKIMLEFPFVNTVALFFGQQRLMWYFVFLQPLHILYTIIAGWLGRFGSYRWKSRRVVNVGSKAHDK